MIGVRVPGAVQGAPRWERDQLAPTVLAMIIPSTQSAMSASVLDPGPPSVLDPGHPPVAAPVPDAGLPPVAAPVAAPIDRASRSLGPDLARGFLLLFIALANVWGYLYGRTIGAGSRPTDGGVADRVVDGVVAFLVDDRSRPMFAILYGFGIAVMWSRMSARGIDESGARRVLRRRSWGLIALGVLHAGLLYSGDILAPYGATGLIALVLVNRPLPTLRRWLIGSFLLGSLATLGLGMLDLQDGPAVEGTASYWMSAVERLIGSGVVTLLSVLMLLFVPHVIVGILVQRAGWLQRPWEHRRTLGRVAAWTAVANLVLNLPWALVVARVWAPADGIQLAAYQAHDVSGFAMGLGYVCLFGWLAAVWHDRPRGWFLTGVTAVGERSLTCYLLQSLAFAPLLSAWGLGWGGRIGTATAAALAVGVWAMSVAVALALHRAGRRGPFEVLLRRAAYGSAALRPAPVAA